MLHPPTLLNTLCTQPGQSGILNPGLLGILRQGVQCGELHLPLPFPACYDMRPNHPLSLTRTSLIYLQDTYVKLKLIQVPIKNPQRFTNRPFGHISAPRKN